MQRDRYGRWIPTEEERTMTIEKAREERRNFYVEESKEHGTFSIASAEASPTWPTRYRGTIFLPRSEHSFRKQSKPNGEEYSISTLAWTTDGFSLYWSGLASGQSYGCSYKEFTTIPKPRFLQRCACARADDFALATASLCESLQTVAKPSRLLTLLLAWPFWQMQIKDDAKYLGVASGPSAAIIDGPERGFKFVGVCARMRTSSQSLVQRLASFNLYALSVLSFIGSVADPDAANIKA